jgi:hypothetical protein
MIADDPIHRHFDGSIDFDYYRGRASLLRRNAFRQMALRIRAIARRATAHLHHI